MNLKSSTLACWPIQLLLLCGMAIAVNGLLFKGGCGLEDVDKQLEETLSETSDMKVLVDGDMTGCLIGALGPLKLMETRMTQYIEFLKNRSNTTLSGTTEDEDWSSENTFLESIIADAKSMPVHLQCLSHFMSINFEVPELGDLNSTLLKINMIFRSVTYTHPGNISDVSVVARIKTSEENQYLIHIFLYSEHFEHDYYVWQKRVPTLVQAATITTGFSVDFNEADYAYFKPLATEEVLLTMTRFTMADGRFISVGALRFELEAELFTTIGSMADSFGDCAQSIHDDVTKMKAAFNSHLNQLTLTVITNELKSFIGKRKECASTVQKFLQDAPTREGVDQKDLVAQREAAIWLSSTDDLCAAKRDVRCISKILPLLKVAASLNGPLSSVTRLITGVTNGPSSFNFGPFNFDDPSSPWKNPHAEAVSLLKDWCKLLVDYFKERNTNGVVRTGDIAIFQDGNDNMMGSVEELCGMLSQLLTVYDEAGGVKGFNQNVLDAQTTVAIMRQMEDMTVDMTLTESQAMFGSFLKSFNNLTDKDLSWILKHTIVGIDQRQEEQPSFDQTSEGKSIDSSPENYLIRGWRHGLLNFLTPDCKKNDIRYLSDMLTKVFDREKDILQSSKSTNKFRELNDFIHQCSKIEDDLNFDRKPSKVSKTILAQFRFMGTYLMRLWLEGVVGAVVNVMDSAFQLDKCLVAIEFQKVIRETIESGSAYRIQDLERVVVSYMLQKTAMLREGRNDAIARDSHIWKRMADVDGTMLHDGDPTVTLKEKMSWIAMNLLVAGKRNRESTFEVDSCLTKLNSLKVSINQEEFKQLRKSCGWTAEKPLFAIIVVLLWTEQVQADARGNLEIGAVEKPQNDEEALRSMTKKLKDGVNVETFKKHFLDGVQQNTRNEVKEALKKQPVNRKTIVDAVRMGRSKADAVLEKNVVQMFKDWIPATKTGGPVEGRTLIEMWELKKDRKVRIP
eukprot:GHVS01016344.1.p1 GENE.GHVS01016344.1~~GHVS01016344.1.p1  ORF type:complete len:962 (-),score=85.36 GHVS01016344.1:41-2926(-)